jgi:hypothetical protein
MWYVPWEHFVRFEGGTMQISIKGTIEDYDAEVRVEVRYEDHGFAVTHAAAEEAIDSLADQVARKLIAARVA